MSDRDTRKINSSTIPPFEERVSNNIKTLNDFVEGFGVSGYITLTQANELFQSKLGYTPENISNKVISISALSTNNQYPTAKLLYDSLSLKLNTSLKGVVNGLAELDENGFVKNTQLPSYVDDVLEFDNFAALPVIGESGKIYVVKDTNKTYRWSGTLYTVISETIALGETYTTAFRGDWGRIAYDYSQIGHEPAFNKNTAFNKNFGTTTGTVLEGRTFGTAANNNTGDFILNQNSSAQSANGWITGTFDASGYKLSSTSLLLDWLKSGSAPASGNIVVGNGTTTNPSGVSVNQAIGGGLMQTNYMQYWDGSKFVNGNLFFVSSVYTQLRDNSYLYFVSRHSTNGGNILFNNGSGQNLILAETADNEYTFGHGSTGSLPVNRTLILNTLTNAVKLTALSGTGTRLVSASSDGTLSNITNGTEGQVLKIVSGVPQFVNP